MRVALYLVLGPILIGQVCTHLKNRYRWAGGYTRKLNHVGIMLITAPLLAVLPDRELLMSVMVATALQVCLYSAAAYSRRPAIHALAAHSLRERDAPRSRFFFLMPMITTNVALVAAVLLFPMDLVKIAFFTVALGDGLAEPVGLWLGRRNTYTVRDFIWGERNTKSFAGSLTVFLFAAVVALAMLGSGSSSVDAGLALSVLTYATAMTALEAASPRGMDNMIMILLGPAVLLLLTASRVGQ
jgi:dolichol kinase